VSAQGGSRDEWRVRPLRGPSLDSDVASKAKVWNHIWLMDRRRELDKDVRRPILYFYTVTISAMNAPLRPEVLRLRDPSPQELLPLATEGVQRYVWESRFGPMLIEVVDGVTYVNGGRVESVAEDSEPPGMRNPT
jgi:hypothetical protein